MTSKTNISNRIKISIIYLDFPLKKLKAEDLEITFEGRNHKENRIQFNWSVLSSKTRFVSWSFPTFEESNRIDTTYDDLKAKSNRLFLPYMSPCPQGIEAFMIKVHKDV